MKCRLQKEESRRTRPIPGIRGAETDESVGLSKQKVHDERKREKETRLSTTAKTGETTKAGDNMAAALSSVTRRRGIKRK